ncbi:hypothetical protein XA68_17809 [Ophiocordyceps unilateralis]|uniref:Uncharacterized protein n=1 Tax=Ophiocordyceps unilateralis TaxID=268505 RepID=A0A2A9P411_OPHUN|nr:hypothetical protein XA68_17809 [Ophiocordyceps unilateralis]
MLACLLKTRVLLGTPAASIHAASRRPRLLRPTAAAAAAGPATGPSTGPLLLAPSAGPVSLSSLPEPRGFHCRRAPALLLLEPAARLPSRLAAGPTNAPQPKQRHPSGPVRGGFDTGCLASNITSASALCHIASSSSRHCPVLDDDYVPESIKN